MPLRRPGGAGERLRSPTTSPSWQGLATKTAEGLKNTPRFLEAEAGQVLDAAKAAQLGSSGGGGGGNSERLPRLSMHVQSAYAGRTRLPRMLHGAARELRPYDETEAFGWRLLQVGCEGRRTVIIPAPYCTASARPHLTPRPHPCSSSPAAAGGARPVRARAAHVLRGRGGGGRPAAAHRPAPALRVGARLAAALAHADARGAARSGGGGTRPVGRRPVAP